jgi:hypothetical protein
VDGVKVTSINPVDQSTVSPEQTRQQSPQESANKGPAREVASKVKESLEKAENGNTLAQYALMIYYSTGDGVETNMVEAIKWGRKAAEGGIPDSQIFVAKEYLKGVNVKQDYLEAARLLQVATVGPEAEARLLLADMYANGTGVPRDREKAIGLLRDATTGTGSTFAEAAKVRLRELDPTGASSFLCVNNLKSIGLALRTWTIDHNGDFPFNAPKVTGGTKEFCLVSNDGFDSKAYIHFMVMSNELTTPKVLICPGDSSRRPANDFGGLQVTNVTYQMRSGADINTTKPKEVVVRCPIHGHALQCNGAVIQGH